METFSLGKDGMAMCYAALMKIEAADDALQVQSFTAFQATLELPSCTVLGTNESIHQD